ncbi:MAG TPA: transketolase C-terminal domain-containing protein [Candidatus Polarisedimenticolia bacterium]|nr:transketolase C-terminal domain-containing protein [Candidatus Polarisedimenticolia bacterium]
MRGAFFRALLELAEQDERVCLVVGDLGFGVVEEFARRFPKRFLNAGVAEQNMTGIAAGMALSGKIVFTYSIANFPILRCLEQVRNDVCYHNANVKIVAVGGGLAYGSLGATHHATEDLAILRSLPRMVVVAPGDPVETEAATRAVGAHAGPCYLRLGRAGEARVHSGQIDFQLGKAIQVRDGKDLTLITTGGMLETSVKVADTLHHAGLQTRLLSMHTVKPVDADAILAAAHDTRAVFTLEEHSVVGGLGGAVAELLAEAGEGVVAFKRLGLPSAFSSVVGTQEYLRAQHGLSVESLETAIRSTLDKNRTLMATTRA